jgi:O-antigen ligase
MNTLSRTIILFLIPYSIFFAIRFFSKKPLRNLVLLAVVLLCLSPLLLLPIDKLKDLWYLRITIDESLGADSAISIRQTIISNVWAELTNIWNLPYYFFGHGQGSGAIIARRALSTTDTLDNEYLALLYENGLLGLCTFLLFWLSPFFQGVKKFKTNIHLWAIIGFLLAGCSFEIIKYTNINFLIFCSLAWIQLKAPSLKSTEFPA